MRAYEKIMKWSEHYKINTHDCDPTGVVRPSLVQRYMQETANMQMKHEGPSNEELREMRLAFLLSRITVSTYAPLHAGDEIDVTSWGCESRGVSFSRCYQIKRGDEIVAEAASIWGLIGIDDHRIVRVGEVEMHFGIDEPLELESTRVHIPRDLGLALVGERPVVYSDLDMNNHMNNTNYPDMFCDFIPEMPGRRVANMAISYVHEAPLGELLKVYTVKSDDVWYVRTVRSDGQVNAEAEIILE